MKLLSLAPLAVLLLQAGLNPPPQQKPTGSIEGTVTGSGTNLPVANARVAIGRRGQPPPGALPAPVAGRGATPALPPIPAVTTDDKGKFVVPDLDNGAYTVQVTANGYVARPYGLQAISSTVSPVASPVNVMGGQPTKDINVVLTPAANISGRIRDSSDQPIVNVSVQLLRYTYNYQGQRSYQSAGTTRTDDHGEYRMYWVTPGRYYLLVGRPSTGSNAYGEFLVGDSRGGGANGNEVPSVLGYAFYPGVQEIANARTIDMQAGADLQSVDLTLVTKPRTFKVRGKIIDSRNGQPPPRAGVFVAPPMQGLGQDDSFFISDSASPNYNGKTGTFEIKDLLPGPYSIVAMVTDTPLPGVRGPVGRSSAMVPVTIGSTDVDNLTISVEPAGSIPGRVSIEGQLPAQMSMERLRVQLVPVGNAQSSLSSVLSNAFYQNSQTNVAADGKFRLVNVVPGEYRVEFGGFPVNASAGPNNPAGTQYIGTMQTGNAYIKDAQLDGADAFNVPLRFSGSVNNGLDVVLAFGSGRVEGTVTDGRSQPVTAGMVVAVPDRLRFRTDLYRPAAIDPGGKFTFPSLPPGDYRIFAWESVEANGWFDPDLLARSEGRAHSVHVAEMSTQTISMQIIPAEGSR
jgi:hypothetical protein